jgi:hypothetical protein
VRLGTHYRTYYYCLLWHWSVDDIVPDFM